MSALLIDYLGVVARPPGEHARALIEKAVGAQGFWEEYRELRPQTLTGTVDERRFWNRLAARGPPAFRRRRCHRRRLGRPP